ncbi:MAG: hypothetical protein HYR94_09655 [Chloroflexi bacterium]|nr:hypothetical protein [Chloroflexota bacterium]
MKNSTPLLKRMRGSRLFWPLVALILIFIVDAIFAPGFFKIGILDGHLFGNLIDIVNNSAPLMLVAIGNFGGLGYSINQSGPGQCINRK